MKRYLLASALMATTVLGTFGVANAGTATAPAVPATQTVSFSVYLPLRNTAALKTLLTAQQTKGSASYHQWLTPAQFGAQFGPTAATISAAQNALTAAGLSVTATHTRAIDVSGPASAVNKTLQTTLKSISNDAGDGTRVISTSKIVIPSALAGAVIPTFQAVPEHKVSATAVGPAPDNRNGPAGSYNYNDLKQAYDYPAYTSLDGTGAHVAIVMEAMAQQTDVAAMFNHESFATTTGKAIPTYHVVKIDGGGHFGGVNDGGTDEAELDVQMVIGGAPGATVTHYSIPDLSDQHIIDAYVTILENNTDDVVTSSFGECELFYTPAYNNGYDFTSTLTLYDEIFEQGSAQGISFLASSGDEGGTGCPANSIIPHFVGTLPGTVPALKGVSTPAVDPWVTAVGGGNLITTTPAFTGDLNSAYISENGAGDPEIAYDEFGIGTNITGQYWGAGGGISQVFARPSWQNPTVTGSANFRTVPDIGMLVGGCPGGISVTPCGPNRSSVVVTISGGRFGFIGTSVASPEFAGAVALLVQAVGGRLGTLNPTLYALGAIQAAAGGPSAPPSFQLYHQGTIGFDGIYTTTATQSYNYIFGNGSPDVRKLFGLTALPAAGVPRTASNPNDPAPRIFRSAAGKA